MQEHYIKQMQSFTPNGGAMQCTYTFETGPRLLELLDGLIDEPDQAIYVQFLNGSFIGSLIPKGTAGWYVKVDDHIIFLKIGKPVKEDIPEITILQKISILGFLYHMPEKDLLEYWVNPDDEFNRMEDYAGKSFEIRSQYLCDLIKKHCFHIQSALEIGCNAGRNLNILKSGLNIKVAGIEINQRALELLKTTFPLIADETFYPGKAQEKIKEIPTGGYDLVFSMAVLMHLHPSTEENFWKNMTRATKHAIITIENEDGSSNRNWPRNYEKILSPYGVREIHNEPCPEEILPNYVTRIFIKES